MTRKKVKLVWIASDNARKASFKKRRLGLLKKVSELTTLCGVFAFAVVNGPDEDHPVIWPSLSVAQHLYRRFLSLPEVERQKKMTNQETYLKECTTKAQDMLKKLIKKNQELELDLLMHQLHQGHHISQLTNGELLALFWMVGERIRDCQKRIEYHQQVHRLPPPPTEFVPSNSSLLEIGSNEMDLVDNGRNLMDQWFIDMVMNSNDKIGGNSSNMAGELGFVQSEVNMGDLMNGENLMVGISELGGTETIIVEGDGDENILLSEWNFGVNDNSGMCEIEKLVNDINGVGVEATVSHMDFTHQAGFGIGGDVNGGDPMGSLYSDACYYGDSGGVRIDVNDDVEMLLQGLFESEISCSNGNEIQHGNGNENQNNEGGDVEDDLLSKEWQNNFTP